MSCEHEHEDAAYVLGALSPDERIAFERHLPRCADCARAVADLAGLPGLLARVPVDVADPSTPAELVPGTLLPGLIERVRRDRRRRTGLTVALVASAAAVAVLAVGLALRQDDGRPTETATATSAGTSPAVAMRSLGDDPVAASISLTQVGWGTRLDLTCDERDESASTDTVSSAAWASYAMYVHTRDGQTEKVATWRALPGKVVRVSAAVATDRTDILSVDVRNAAGTPVLDLG